jgi:hypothetical protein
MRGEKQKMNDAATGTQATENVIEGEFTDLQTTPKPMQMAVRAEMSPDDLRNQIRRQMELREIMTQYLRDSMVEGHHYYYFNKLGKQGQAESGGPRDDKPALTQDGAYNLMGLFKCVAGPAITNIIRHGDGHLTVVSEVPIYNQEGALVATGNGSCTTRESKYAYRKGERTCPECNGAFINKSKFPPKGQPNTSPGWYCYAKIGGCGAEFAATDARITEQVVGRVENPDLADLENTVLKMSVKRANTAGVRKLPLVSEIFTTDPNEGEDPKAPAKTAARSNGNSKPQQRQSAQTAEAPPTNDPVKKAVDLAYKLQKDHNVEAEDLARQFLPEGVMKFSDLNEQQALDVLPGLVDLLNSKLNSK